MRGVDLTRRRDIICGIMPITTQSIRVLVSLPPELAAPVGEAADAAGQSVPAYITATLAKKHKVKSAKDIRRGRKRNPENLKK